MIYHYPLLRVVRGLSGMKSFPSVRNPCLTHLPPRIRWYAPLKAYSTGQGSSYWLTPERPSADRIVSARQDNSWEDPFQTGFFTHPAHAEKRMVKRHKELGAFSSRYDRSVIYAIRGAGSVDKVLDILELATSSSSLSVIVYEEALRSAAWFGSRRDGAAESGFSSEKDIAMQKMLKRLNDALRNPSENVHPGRLWGIVRAAGMLRDRYTKYSNNALIRRIIESSIGLLLSEEYSTAMTDVTTATNSWTRSLHDLAVSGIDNPAIIERLLEKLMITENRMFDDERMGRSLAQSIRLLFRQPDLFESLPGPQGAHGIGNMADHINFGFPPTCLWDQTVWSGKERLPALGCKGIPINRLKRFTMSLLEQFNSACQRDDVGLRWLQEILQMQRVISTSCADNDVCHANKGLLIECFHRLLRYLRNEGIVTNELRRVSGALRVAAQSRASIILEMNLPSSFLSAIQKHLFDTYWNNVYSTQLKRATLDVLSYVAEATYLCKSALPFNTLLSRCRNLNSKLSADNINLEALSYLAVTWTDMTVMGASSQGSNAASQLQQLGKDISDKLLQLPASNVHDEHRMWKLLLNMSICGRLTQVATPVSQLLSCEPVYRRFQEYAGKLNDVLKDYLLELQQEEKNAISFSQAAYGLPGIHSERMRPSPSLSHLQNISTVMVAVSVLHSFSEYAFEHRSSRFHGPTETLLRLPRRKLLHIMDLMDSHTFSNFLLTSPELGNACRVSGRHRRFLEAHHQSLGESCLHLSYTPHANLKSNCWYIIKCLKDVDPISTAEFRLHNSFLCGLVACSRIALTSVGTSSRIFMEYYEPISKALRYNTSLMTNQGSEILLAKREVTITQLLVSLQVMEELLQLPQPPDDPQIRRCVTTELLPLVLRCLFHINDESRKTESLHGSWRTNKSYGARSFSTYAKQQIKLKKPGSTENQRIKLREQVGAPAAELFDEPTETIEHLEDAATQYEEHRIDGIWDELGSQSEHNLDESDRELDDLELIFKERAQQLEDSDAFVKYVSSTTARIDRAVTWIPSLLNYDKPSNRMLALACICAQICKIQTVLQQGGDIINIPLDTAPIAQECSRALVASATAAFQAIENSWKEEKSLHSAAQNTLWALKINYPSHPVTQEGSLLFGDPVALQQPIQVHYSNLPSPASEFDVKPWLKLALSVLQGN
eukprot:gb/GECG01007369.1/.p1 GENE.gb/GECG01007369.1/~~gb/GECG01007369.1/.p1  ORF type:complete len:1176 (+),score=118.28 gb/GECG01007369.1/:1-3528(+)